MENTLFNEDFSLTEQASDTFGDTQDSNGNWILPEMQSPKLSPLQNPSPARSPPPRTPGGGTIEDQSEDLADLASAGEAHVGHATLPLSPPKSPANFTQQGSLFNEYWLKYSNDGIEMNGFVFDFENAAQDSHISNSDNLNMNSSTFDHNNFSQAFPVPAPLSPLSSPTQDFKHFPVLHQLSSTSTVHPIGISNMAVPDHLPTTATPQELHQAERFSAQDFSPQDLSVLPYPNQVMPMVPPSFPTPQMLQAPVANMTHTHVPYQSPKEFPPTIRPQGQFFEPGFRGDSSSVPNGVDTSFVFPGNTQYQQFPMPSIEDNPQDLAGSPKESRIKGHGGRKPNAKTVTRDFEEINPGFPREEPQIIHRLKPGFDPEKPWIKTNKNMGLNRRAGRIAAFKPEEIYTPLPQTPAAWDDFTYESTGELAGGRLFEPKDIEHFLYANPRELVIWLQREPADSARRYGGMERGMCRFKNCCNDSNTIQTGWYRVTFDENSRTYTDIDPMHNAGYVHLYCMEKFLDFPQICQDLNVKVDNRALVYEDNSRNKMKYSKIGEVEVAQDFVRACRKTGKAPGDYPPFQTRKRSHRGTLAWLLSVAKFGPGADEYAMEQQRQKQQMSIHEVHMGNLELFNKYRVRAKPKEPQPRESRRRVSTRKMAKKSRRNEYESDESPKPRRRESIKRRRDDYESDESPEPSRRDTTRRDSTKKVSRKRHRDEYETDESSPEPRKRSSTRKSSIRRRRHEYQSDESDGPPRRYAARKVQTRKEPGQKVPTRDAETSTRPTYLRLNLQKRCRITRDVASAGRDPQGRSVRSRPSDTVTRPPGRRRRSQTLSFCHRHPRTGLRCRRKSRRGAARSTRSK